MRAQKNYPAAIDYYKKAVVMTLVNESAENKLWKAYRESKNFSDAANFYRAILAITFKGDMWFNLGYSLYELKDYEGAIAAYTKNGGRSDSFAAYNNRGLVYRDLGRYDEAIQDFKAALELKPDYESARRNLWDTCYKAGRIDDAIDFYKACVIKNSNDTNADKNLWDAYCKSGKFDDAIDFYKACVIKNSNDTNADKNLWDAYCKSGKFDDAVDFYTEWVKYYNKKDDQSWFRFARSLQKLRRYPEAIKAMQKSIELKPTADKYWWLAEIYESAGTKRKIIMEAYQKALELDPKHANAEIMKQYLRDHRFSDNEEMVAAADSIEKG